MVCLSRVYYISLSSLSATWQGLTSGVLREVQGYVGVECVLVWLARPSHDAPRAAREGRDGLAAIEIS